MTQTHEDALTTDQEEIIDYILYASSGLSMIGSLFIIFTFIVFKETRTFGTKLIFFLSISDFFTSLSWFPWYEIFIFAPSFTKIVGLLGMWIRCFA